MACKFAMACASIVIPFAEGIASAQGAERTPWAQDVVLWDHVLWYGGQANDGPPRLPFPPLHQIPPVPWPDAALCINNPDAPHSVLHHDARTGQTAEIQVVPARLASSGFTTGFRGIDGGDGSEGGAGRAFGQLTLVENTEDFPWRVNAIAIIRTGSGGYTHCSAALLDAEVALLAGHCVYDQVSGWAQEVFIVPGWDGVGSDGPPSLVMNPYGWASGTEYIIGGDWVDHGNYDRDMAAVALTRAAGMLTGWFGRAWGGTCPDIQARTYHNASYPSEACYDGRDMYYWFGNFDSCPGNQVEFDFGGQGCEWETWGGMSGSNAYYEQAGERLSHAVCSQKIGHSSARYCKMWLAFDGGMGLLIDSARGNTLDIQPLDCGGPAKSLPGNTINLNHVCTNPTNNDPPSRTYTFTWYLSSNEEITTADTPLTTRNVTLDLSSLAIDPALAMATVASSGVQIPANTPYGTYWLGVIYDSSTDGNSGNNDATTWDAHKIIIGIFP